MKTNKLLRSAFGIFVVCVILMSVLFTGTLAKYTATETVTAAGRVVARFDYDVTAKGGELMQASDFIDPATGVDPFQIPHNANIANHTGLLAPGTAGKLGAEVENLSEVAIEVLVALDPGENNDWLEKAGIYFGYFNDSDVFVKFAGDATATPPIAEGSLAAAVAGASGAKIEYLAPTGLTGDKAEIDFDIYWVWDFTDDEDLTSQSRKDTELGIKAIDAPDELAIGLILTINQLD